MCVVSYIGDDWRNRQWPSIKPEQWPIDLPSEPVKLPGISREEFERLKKEIEELKKLLTAAKEYDKKTGQADCHMDEKVKLIKKLAEITGVSVKELF